MRPWPHGLAGRIALALAVAGLGIAGLALLVQEPAPAAASAPARSVAPVPRGLGFLLAPCGGPVWLVARASSVAPDQSPVLQVFADGSVALRRPGALALRPGPAGGGPAAAAAAIVLPGPSLSELGAGARGALLDLIGQLVEVRPVPLERVRTGDFGVPPAELAALLQWVP